MKGLICLILPILFTFSGFFSFNLLNFSENSNPEQIKFFLSLGGFLIGTIISFIISRKNGK